ncbi:MAG TPA: transcriptional repressor [Propionicimonas sp.]|mgnify:FL=1|nr:transcriptional repressor [Propionicimonas sp.]HQA77242.1 transcriptional repressor [Propionicimonas sp.]HQD96069.1 transcriptional repressor [Propionicimonas sp.]
MTSTEPATPRQTRQRAEIRQAAEALATFATAQEIHDQLRHQGSGVGLATVYRTLQSMAASGELDAIRTPDGQTAYRTCSPGHHHHLICRSCGRTVEVALPSIEKLVGGIAAQHSFTKLDHELEFYGICAECA